MSSDNYHYVYYEKSLDHELLLVHDSQLDRETRFVPFVKFDDINPLDLSKNLSNIILTKTIYIPETALEDTVIVIAPIDKYNGANHILYETYIQYVYL